MHIPYSLHWMTSTQSTPTTCRVRTATPSAKRSCHPLLAPPWSLMHWKRCHSPSKWYQAWRRGECGSDSTQRKNKTAKRSIFWPGPIFKALRWLLWQSLWRMKMLTIKYKKLTSNKNKNNRKCVMQQSKTVTAIWKVSTASHFWHALS